MGVLIGVAFHGSVTTEDQIRRLERHCSVHLFFVFWVSGKSSDFSQSLVCGYGAQSMDRPPMVDILRRLSGISHYSALHTQTLRAGATVSHILLQGNGGQWLDQTSLSCWQWSRDFNQGVVTVELAVGTEPGHGCGGEGHHRPSALPCRPLVLSSNDSPGLKFWLFFF